MPREGLDVLRDVSADLSSSSVGVVEEDMMRSLRVRNNIDNGEVGMDTSEEAEE